MELSGIDHVGIWMFCDIYYCPRHEKLSSKKFRLGIFIFGVDLPHSLFNFQGCLDNYRICYSRRFCSGYSNLVACIQKSEFAKIKGMAPCIYIMVVYIDIMYWSANIVYIIPCIFISVQYRYVNSHQPKNKKGAVKLIYNITFISLK